MNVKTIKFVRESLEEDETNEMRIRESLYRIAKDLRLEKDPERLPEQALQQFVSQTLVSQEETAINTEFNEWYVNQITQGFASELEQLGKSGNDVNDLVEILRGGCDTTLIFDARAKEAIVETMKKPKTKF